MQSVEPSPPTAEINLQPVEMDFQPAETDLQAAEMVVQQCLSISATDYLNIFYIYRDLHK